MTIVHCLCKETSKKAISVLFGVVQGGMKVTLTERSMKSSSSE